MATVNIYNATTTQNGNNTILVSFDLLNKIGVQPGVKYGLMLIKDGKIIADEFVADKVVSLSEGEISHQVIQYTYPSYFDGDYRVFIVTKSIKGLTFGTAYAGDVILKKQNKENGFVVSTSPCYIVINNEKIKYEALQGVDVNVGDILQVHCSVVSTKKNKITATPTIIYYERDFFGNKISENKEQTISIAEGASEIHIPIVVPQKPQSYDAVISLHNNNEKIFTSRVHFVVRGASATVQNAIFDKIKYKKGDIATIKVFWTPSADIFEDAHASGTPLTVTNLNTSIINRLGDTCSEKISQQVDSKTPFFWMKIVITGDCDGPEVRLSLTDSQYGILDNANFVVAVYSSSSEEITSSSNSLVSKIVLFLLAIIIILVIIFLYMYKIKTSTPVVKVVSILLLMLGSISLNNRVHADTFSYTQDSTVTFTVNFNQTTYTAGSPMTVTASGLRSGCGNSCNFGGECRSVTLLIDNAGGAVFPSNVVIQSDGMNLGSNVVQGTTPSTAGSQSISFRGSNYSLANIFIFGPGLNSTTFSMSYITTAPPPTVQLYFSKAVEYFKNIFV